jgi:MFS transporter, SHS family, lactate transporter
MSEIRTSTTATAWWKEPTKDQWYAYIAAWLGWTLDTFDFTVFLVLIPSYMNERFPTEVRVTASAFCYHQGDR